MALIRYKLPELQLLLWQFIKASPVILSLSLCACGGNKFESQLSCKKYIEKTSMTEEKLTLGSSACEWVFDDFSKTEQSDDAVKESRKQKVLKKFGTCLLNNIDKIIDDATGAKIVSGCGESEKLPDLARAVSQIFSESFRIRYEHDRQRLENAKHEEALNPLDLNILNVTKDDRFNPIIMDINGDLKTCFKIGVVLSCD